MHLSNTDTKIHLYSKSAIKNEEKRSILTWKPSLWSLHKNGDDASQQNEEQSTSCRCHGHGPLCDPHSSSYGGPLGSTVGGSLSDFSVTAASWWRLGGCTAIRLLVGANKLGPIVWASKVERVRRLYIEEQVGHATPLPSYAVQRRSQEFIYGGARRRCARRSVKMSTESHTYYNLYGESTIEKS